MTTIHETRRIDTAAARSALLALHGALLAEARIAHEREHGRTSNAAFLQLAAHDPAFAWLGVLLGLVVRLDMEEDREPILAAAAALLRCEGGGEFATRYESAIQRSPDVAVAGARARGAVGGSRRDDTGGRQDGTTGRR